MKFILFVWTLVGIVFCLIDSFSMKRNFNLFFDSSLVIFYILSLIHELFKNSETICPYNENKI
jgi:hypothetical protein